MKKKDSLLVRAVWTIRNVTPDPIEVYYVRLYRYLLQLKGLPFSGGRPGVVVMLHIGRCGSTVLANMLDQNPRIFWDGKTARKADELYGGSIKSLDISGWFKRQFAISGGRYYGFEFKILADQYADLFDTSISHFLEMFQSIGVTHFILLYRGNTLNQTISHYSGLHNKIWHVSSDSGKQSSSKSFSIDFEHVTTGSGDGLPLRDYLYDIEKTKDEVRHTLRGQNLLELQYESDILESSPMKAYQKVCEFLEIPKGDVSVKNKKVLALSPSEAVENYGDAVRALSGTEFEWMLDRNN